MQKGYIFMLKKHKKSILNALFFILVFGLTIWAIFKNSNLEQTLYYMQSANPFWLLCGIPCVLVYILAESVIIFYMMHSFGTKVPFTRCCMYSFVGFFYCAITPSASGGQPMQVVQMHKDKISPAVSTVVLAIITITYKLVLVVLGVAVLILRPESIMPFLAPVEWLMHIGIWLNIVFIALLFLLVFHPSLIRTLGNKLFLFLNRIKPFKDLEKRKQQLENLIAQYDGAASYYKSHPVIICNVFLITLAQRIFLFGVTWLVYRGLGLSETSAIVIILLQAMISVAVDMMPLPGGMGISETLFLTIFLPIFGSDQIFAGMILSRGISYYTQLIISAIMTFVETFLLHKRKPNS